MKKQNLIESIVGIIFGITILLTAIFADSTTTCIVFGALLLAASVGILIYTIVAIKNFKKKQQELIQSIKDLAQKAIDESQAAEDPAVAEVDENPEATYSVEKSEQ